GGEGGRLCPPKRSCRNSSGPDGQIESPAVESPAPHLRASRRIARAQQCAASLLDCRPDDYPPCLLRKAGVSKDGVASCFETPTLSCGQAGLLSMRPIISANRRESPARKQ